MTCRSRISRPDTHRTTTKPPTSRSTSSTTTWLASEDSFTTSCGRWRIERTSRRSPARIRPIRRVGNGRNAEATMAGFTKTEFIWMNGALRPWAEAQVHITAHGLHYGTGVFEGMRSYDTPDGPAIFRLDAHIRRFAASASAYELALPYSFDELCSASLDVVSVNKLENAYLRPLAFFDSHSFSVWPKECHVTVAIIAVPGRQYLQGGPENGVRVTVSTTRRIDPSALPPHVKACGQYTNSVRAVQDALRRGYDEAILLNSKGDVAEGS